MKDRDYVMHLWNETEMRRKDKEARKNMTQNKKSDVDGEGEKEKEMIQNQKSEVDSNRNKGKNQHSFVEKTLLVKEQQKHIKEEEAAKSGVSSGSKRVHEFVDEHVKEDVATSRQQNTVVQSPSKAKQQKME